MSTRMAAVGGKPERQVPGHTASSFRTTGTSGGFGSFAAWLALIGLLFPAWEMTVYIAGAKFTAGRLGVALLFIPALAVLCQHRRLVLTDLFAFLTASWMLVAAVSVGGRSSISSAGAESLEFIAGYLAARVFFATPAALDTFIRVLKALTVVVIVLAMADSISGRWIAHDLAASLLGTVPLGPVFRGDMIRATSTFDHPILFGVFCGLVAAILLFWERNTLRRIFYVGLCLVGVILSQSSAALMCFTLALAAYTYDRSLRNVPSRWTIFWTIVGILLTFLFLLSRNPIGWIISHLTLDPATGYFRLLIWTAALDRISENPLTGYAIELFDQQILDNTVDSVWLVMALRFGAPTIVFLFLANITACFPQKQFKYRLIADSGAHRMRLAFTIVLFMFMFTGLTVHFWNYMWIFWGLCLGIRASLREMSILGTTRPAFQPLAEVPPRSMRRV